MNEKTVRSQIIGGVIYGLGQALMEATEYDSRWANPVTRTSADYHVPVNLDVPPIDVFCRQTRPAYFSDWRKRTRRNRYHRRCGGDCQRGFQRHGKAS